MSRIRTLLAALPALAAMASVPLLGGCAASGSPDYDSRFGDAARALNAQQLLDPQAPTRNAGVTKPSDGRTVREAMDRQVDSFKQPPATNVINIGVGAGGNGN
jgi:hypothetical protein